MSVKHAIFLLGLPGAGKTSWIDEFIKINIEQKVLYKIVSADEIRLNHPDYNPKEPEKIHELCIQLAEAQMYENGEHGYNVIMDGGGINNNYTVRIINKMKEYGYFITVTHIDTPAHICIERNNNRIKNGERFVPVESIIDKSYRINKSIETLKEISDSYKRIPYFTNKYFFFDLDGTLAEYQTLPVDSDGDINFVGYNVFKYSKSVEPMITRLLELQNILCRKIFIISASPNSICNEEKKSWVKKHLKFIDEDNIYFVGNRNFKHTFLKHLMLKLDIKPNECTVVDDDHKILELYKTIGVNTVHPSKLLSNDLKSFF